MKFLHSVKKGLALVTLVALAIMALNLAIFLVPGVNRAEAATAYYVNPVGTDDVSHGLGPGTAAFKTIQYAINTAAAFGDTINVAAGTYTEDITVNKSLTILGAQSNVDATGGSWTGSTVIEAPGAAGATQYDGFSPHIKANNVVFKGFKVKATAVPTNNSGFYVGGEHYVLDNIEIANCEVTGRNEAGLIVSRLEIDSSITNLNINHVYAHDNASGNGIKMNNIAGPSISYNKITANGTTGAGIENQYGLWLGATNSSVDIHASVQNNTFSGNGVSAGNGGSVLIKQHSGSAQIITGTVINNNSFAETAGYYGINNTFATTIDGTSNWWGKASGPTHATNTKYLAYGETSTGAVVSDNVTFMPWLSAASGGSSVIPVTRTSPTGSFLNPAAAIADAATITGSTLTLAAGTFTDLGTTTVNKSVTIRSAAGTYNVAAALQTKITGTGRFLLNANNIVLDGLLFETTTRPLGSLVATSGVNITDNKFHNIVGVAIEVAGGTNMTISGNAIDTVTNDGLANGMFLSAMTGTTITNNNIANCAYIGIVNSNSTNLTITKNTFNNIGSSGEAGFNLHLVNGATVSGNTMTNAPIYLYASTLTTGTINITNNTITNPAGPSAGKAILTDGSNLGGATVNITSNNLANNSYGVYNPGTVDINARNNWWGSSSGPYNATSNPSGTGSAVTDHVIFNPWNTTVTASYSWQFVSQTSDKNLANLSPGETATITLTAKNTGNATWVRTGSNPVRVGTTNPRDRMSVFANGTWLGANRPVGLPEGTDSVAPGANVTFTWTYTAPATAGTYRENFSLLAEGITWMNDPGVNYYTVVKGNYSWQFVSQTSDKNLANLSTGEEATITLRAKNTGTATWFRTGNFPVRVGTTHPRDRMSVFANGTWLGANRPVGLPGGTTSVAPGVSVTFTWTYTAPATAGTYRENFSLLAEGITWMNDPGVNYYTVVVAAPTPITAIGAITGTPRVGQVLTAGALTPAGATASYQWKIADTVGGTYSNIVGATSSTYTVVAGNLGKFIKVVATGTGSYTDTATSAAKAIYSDIVLVAENFNTNRAGDYYGATVGYELSGANAGNVASASVALYDGSNTLMVTNTSKSAAKVNNTLQGPHYSSAFRVKIGTYTSSTTWNLGAWAPTATRSVKPARAVITLTDINGYTYTVENTNFLDAPPSHDTWASLFPTLTYTAGAGGSVTGITPQAIESYGLNGTAVGAVAAAGYHFTKWSDDSTANPRTDLNVQGDVTVTANFAANQLTIADPTLTLSKPYDANTTAVVTAGALIGVGSPDVVTVSAVANYNTANVGIDKTITVVYTLGGADAAKYIKPVDYVVHTGEITAAVALDIVLTPQNLVTNRAGDYYGVSSNWVLSGTDVAQVASVKVELFNEADGLMATNTSKSADKVNIAKGYSSAFIVKAGTYPTGGTSSTWSFGIWSPTSGTPPHYAKITVTDTHGFTYVANTSDLGQTPPANVTWASLFSVALRYTSGANGVINGTLSQDVAYGASGTAVTAVANNGYHFTGWSDGVATAARTDLYTGGDKTVTANFVQTDIVLTPQNLATNRDGYYYGVSSNWILGGTDASKVASVSVALYDTDHVLMATNTSKSAAKVNNTLQGPGYSSAFLVKPGTYSTSSTWNFGAWYGGLASSKSADYATITVTDIYGSTYVGNTSDLSNTQNVSWASLFSVSLAYTAGANGSLTGTASQTVAYGASGTAVTAVGNSGYHFVNWSDGVATAARTDLYTGGDKTVTANFEADHVINIATIPGVTAPVTGATPVTTITETAQYTGAVTWSPVNNPFAGTTVYTATIMLTPKTGYTLTGVSADFFTVAGSTFRTNPANSGTVTAVFPVTL